MEKITKGEMLKRVFNRMDELKLSEKMVKLFLDNGMNWMDLTELRERNENAFKTWYKYYHRGNRLMAFTTYTVLER